MNNTSNGDELPDPIEPIQVSSGWWQKTTTFLNRDIKTFFSTDEPKSSLDASTQEDAESIVSALKEEPIAALVDPSKLLGLVFKREVIDWRDNFHAEMAVTINSLQTEFIQHAIDEIHAVNVFRKLVARPSNEVLQDGFIRVVRLPLIIALRQQEAKLKASASKWGLFGKVDLNFEIGKLNAECEGLKNVAFRGANKKVLEARIQDLICGPAGLAEHFYDQGLHLSRKYLDANYDR